MICHCLKTGAETIVNQPPSRLHKWHKCISTRMSLVNDDSGWYVFEPKWIVGDLLEHRRSHTHTKCSGPGACDTVPVRSCQCFVDHKALRWAWFESTGVTKGQNMLKKEMDFNGFHASRNDPIQRPCCCKTGKSLCRFVPSCFHGLLQRWQLLPTALSTHIH